MTRKEKLMMLLALPKDYITARKKFKCSKSKLKPKYRDNYTRYFFSIVQDLWHDGQAHIEKYALPGVKTGKRKKQ